MTYLLAFVEVCILLAVASNGVNSDGVVSFDISWKLTENDNKIGLACPNNRTKCTDRQTCCETKHKSYHCCKYENAVCCPDKFHCCPEGSTCDTRRHKCVKPNYKMLTLHSTNDAEKPIEQQLESACPNNITKCKDSKTCCITKYGSYYCCPHKNAVCCSNKYQCCPQGTTCDLKNEKCVKSTISVDMYQHNNKPNPETMIELAQLKPALRHFIDAIFIGGKLGKQCPNSHTDKCPGEKRCCPLLTGKFGCCSFNNGVCCPDLKSCCPHGTECDLKNNKCTANPTSLLPLMNDTSP